jgi:S1-C subfamily serine protease
MMAIGAIIAVGSAAIGGATARLTDSDDPAAQQRVASPTRATGPGGSQEPALEDVVNIAKPSVVEVRTSRGQGSGVIVEPQGLIVTNEHVISGASRVEIVTSTGEQVPADVVSADAKIDLAILRPAASAGPGVTLVDDTVGPPPVGGKVFAIGSPFGLRNTVTAGIVSAYRTDQGRGLIQFDAPINPGNSGGGLFDLSGQLVGIPTQIASPIPGNVGIGFAVPASRVREQLSRVR